MTRAVTIITPRDRGQRMSLEEFDQAEGQEGYLYELGRGRVIVVDVPNRPHFDLVDFLRQQLSDYRSTRPGVIYRILGGGECKLLIPGCESERHPDLAVYKTPPPRDEREMWSSWIPEIVIELVSPGSEHRDYVEKREEYLAFGVHEYWIVDAAKQQVLVLRRTGGQWVEHPRKPGQTHKTHLLPDFELDIAALFTAAKA